MNLLTKSLPTKVEIDNVIYDVNYDYRSIIRILCAFENNDLTNGEKIYIMLEIFYKGNIPPNVEKACELACKFIDLGEGKINKDNPQKRIYSFEKDGNYIFTGINSTHHIDLSVEEKLHWWKFMALFMDMDTECFFSDLIYYRKRKAEGKLTKDEKKRYKELKELIELDDEATIKKSELRKAFFDELRGR